MGVTRTPGFADTVFAEVVALTRVRSTIGILHAMKRTRLILLPLALFALLAFAATAGATTVYPPTFNALDRGNLFKRGQLQDRTVYAEVGQNTIVTAGDVVLSRGTVLVNDLDLVAYECPTTSKKIRPSLRTDCRRLGSKDVRIHQEVAFFAPAGSAGKYMSVEQVSVTVGGGKVVKTYRWAETPIFPGTAVSAGQAQIIGKKAYGGAPVTFQQRNWRTADGTSARSYRTEAWVCPNNKPSRDDRDMKKLGCTRVTNKTSATNDQQTFTLSGRVANRPSVGKRLYFQSFLTVNGPSNVGSLTYELRSAGYRIYTIPAPRAVVYATNGTAVEAAFVPLNGVRYEITGKRTTGNRIISRMCALDVNLMECTLPLEVGTWRVTLIPKGKLATGRTVSRNFTISAPAPAR